MKIVANCWGSNNTLEKTMNDLDRQKYQAVADAAKKYGVGRISRRQFLDVCRKAGFAFSFGGLGLLGSCEKKKNESEKSLKKRIRDTAGAHSAIEDGTDEQAFLKDVGHTFSGQKLKIVSEDTPPSLVTKDLLKEEFTPLTGIEVDWETLPLDQVLAKVAADTARQAGIHDIYYLDQAWTGRFYNHTVDPRELLAKSDLAYPNYNFDDFMEPLVKYVASYKGNLFGIPYDTPIFIMMYRRDILEKLGLPVPTTMDQYTQTVKAINDEMAPATYGTTGMWKSGHSSLECAMTAWLWAHGGSIYREDGKPAINDEKAAAAMAYMLKLADYMPPESTTWDWFGEKNSFAEGRAGIYISYGSLFPSYDDPEQSKIVGLAEPAPCPKEFALRPESECGFDEKPGFSHQGGSCMAISRYSKHIDSAWVFLQWATSADVATRASVLRGVSSMVRKSTYDDPRIKEKARVTVGTTRHFEVVKDAILNRMGSEPHLPAWPELSEKVFPLELGRMTTGQQTIKVTLDNMAVAALRVAESVKK